MKKANNKLQNCLKCKKKNFTKESNFCKVCTFELIDPFWAEQYKNENEKFFVYQNKQQKQCDKCYTQTKEKSWTWASKNHDMFDHTYCNYCINFYCLK